MLQWNKIVVFNCWQHAENSHCCVYKSCLSTRIKTVRIDNNVRSLFYFIATFYFLCTANKIKCNAGTFCAFIFWGYLMLIGPDTTNTHTDTHSRCVQAVFGDVLLLVTVGGDVSAHTALREAPQKHSCQRFTQILTHTERVTQNMNRVLEIYSRRK